MGALGVLTDLVDSPLAADLTREEARSLVLVFLAILLVTRGTAALMWLRGLGPRQTVSLALFAATGLPLIVAIVGIGSERGDISDSVGASLIGAGMISVLVYPLVGMRLVRTPAEAGETFAARTEAEEY